jgi:amidase
VPVTPEDVLYRPLWEIAEAIERRALSPVELGRAQLERIERLDGKLQSYATVLAESALEDARRAELEIWRGDRRGPLHGVPIAVKDLCAMRGVTTACGTVVLREPVPDFDAAVVERLRGAGAVLLGKLQLTEGAYGNHHPSVSPPLNPWDASRWVGVSSSGSGAATAAGLCFAALGTDTGGSIRFPSASCGVVGLKPTYGRVPLHGVFPLAPSLDHVGPMVRSVRDAALLLEVLAGFDARDPTSRREPPERYSAELDAGVRGVRIGIDARYVSEGVDACVRDAVLAGAAVLAQQGAALVEMRLPSVEELTRAWILICATEVALVHEALYPARAAEYGPALSGLIDLGRRLPALELQRSVSVRRLFCAQLAHAFEGVDLIACPSMPWTTPAAERSPEADLEDRGTSSLLFTAPFNFSGYPTLSLPCGFSPEGWPLSLQLVARPLHEALLLRAGWSYERATPWHARHPSL